MQDLNSVKLSALKASYLVANTITKGGEMPLDIGEK